MTLGRRKILRGGAFTNVFDFKRLRLKISARLLLLLIFLIWIKSTHDPPKKSQNNWPEEQLKIKFKKSIKIFITLFLQIHGCDLFVLHVMFVRAVPELNVWVGREAPQIFLHG